jgi:hypothetical protein
MKKLQEILNANGAKLEVDGVVGNFTLTALHMFIKAQITKRKWVMPKDGFVWLRTDEKLTNSFDDFVAVYKNGMPIAALPCSTTAGDFYVFNPLSVGGITGTAIAAEQQVIDSHQFVTNSNWKSLWLGAPYFQQVRPITIYRDGNKDRIIDKKINQLGLYGINFHRAGVGSIIDRWSAGCQVVPDKQWFSTVSHFTNGQIVDYTLIQL